MLETFKRVLFEEHAVVSASAWGAYDPIVPRYIRAECLALEMLWLMAAEAFLYNFAYPDLGCASLQVKEPLLLMHLPQYWLPTLRYIMT